MAAVQTEDVMSSESAATAADGSRRSKFERLAEHVTEHPRHQTPPRLASVQSKSPRRFRKLTRCEHREPRRRAAAALRTERFSQQHVRCFTMVYWTAKKDKASLLANNNQTAALASFVGGFASYGLAGARPYCDETICLVMYVLCLFAVHASFCSALTSALLHRVISNMDEEDVLKWAERAPIKLILKLPLYKFFLGCVAFLANVLVEGWYKLQDKEGPWRFIGLGVGAASLSTVILTVLFVMCDSICCSSGSKKSARSTNIDTARVTAWG